MTLYSYKNFAPECPENGDYFVAPDANVIGKVRLGEASSIWFGATLRGDNELIDVGEGSNVQENSVLHTDMGFPLTIGENCTVGHMAILHGCTIGNQSLIGMGATVMNGAVIGENCLIAAGALVTEGQNIPDGSLAVGRPAKVIRSLDDEAIAKLAKSATQYQKRAADFRESLAVIPIDAG